MNLENIPFEVQKVWVYQSLNQPVGLELYKEIESIIKNIHNILSGNTFIILYLKKYIVNIQKKN